MKGVRRAANSCHPTKVRSDSSTFHFHLSWCGNLLPTEESQKRSRYGVSESSNFDDSNQPFNNSNIPHYPPTRLYFCLEPSSSTNISAVQSGKNYMGGENGCGRRYVLSNPSPQSHISVFGATETSLLNRTRRSIPHKLMNHHFMHELIARSTLL